MHVILPKRKRLALQPWYDLEQRKSCSVREDESFDSISKSRIDSNTMFTLIRNIHSSLLGADIATIFDGRTQ